MEINIDSLVKSDIRKVVAVEPGDNGTAVLYCRKDDGTTERQEAPFSPWLLLGELNLCDCMTMATELEALDGEGNFNVRVNFKSMQEYQKALAVLKKETGYTPAQNGTKIRAFNDKPQQFLTKYQVRLFSDMNFNELHRLQLDIETRAAGEKHFPDPNRPGDEIFLISIKDSLGYENCLSLKGITEKELLEKMVAVIQERDPDVIEGHNIFNFDLNYIAVRCKMHGVKFAIGRDGSEPTARDSKLTVSERIIPYKRFEIYGRHIVDTLHLVLLYDAIHRDMPGHGLKIAAKYFKVASPERTYVAGDDISNIFDTDTERLIAYCLDDVRETDALSRILSPSYFYQTRLVPMTYQNCIVRGTAARIDALLCAEYLSRNFALPSPEPAQFFQGALTEGDKQGIFRNVWHVDVRSLYPSIIISKQLTPASDTHGIFLKMLTELRRFRLAAKDARKTASPQEKEFYDALQSTFKILINAFYGYTGYSMGTFNDYAMAAQITATGREILSGMRDFLESKNATVIEMDTDGIYFAPPANITDMPAFAENLQTTLPEGIEIELDANYKAMFGYKSKNYALLCQDGTVLLSGAALKSRGTEAFQRNYMKDIITLLLTERQDEIDSLYAKYAQDIQEHNLPISDFAKREYLSTSIATYQRNLASGKSKRSAAYELAIASGKEYKQGDAVDFYVTGNKKSVSVTENSKLLADAGTERDENIPFYLSKLQQLHKKLFQG